MMNRMHGSSSTSRPGTIAFPFPSRLLALSLAGGFPRENPSWATFQADLELDSLDTVELVMAIKEEFAIEIPDAEADKILSCGDAIAYLSAHPQAA